MHSRTMNCRGIMVMARLANTSRPNVPSMGRTFDPSKANDIYGADHRGPTVARSARANLAERLLFRDNDCLSAGVVVSAE